MSSPPRFPEKPTMFRQPPSLFSPACLSALLCVPLSMYWAVAQEVPQAAASSSGEISATATVSVIETYNQQLRKSLPEIKAANVAGPVASALLGTLTARQKLVERLIPFGLDAVTAVRLTPDERRQFVQAIPEADGLIEDDVEIAGQPQELVADDFAHKTSHSLWRIATPTGRYHIFREPAGA
jgi:hypothetical protein